MISTWIFRLLKWTVISFLSLILIILLAVGAFDVYQWRKYPEKITLDISFTQNGCEEGCNDYIVKSVNNSNFSWLKGKIVNVVRHSEELGRGLEKEWLDQGYRNYCITGQLHKAKDHYLWFYQRDVYNFTGHSIRPGMCSNPKAKRFKP